MYEKILILKKKKDRKTLDQAKINNILFWIADMHLDKKIMAVTQLPDSRFFIKKHKRFFLDKING